jgi:hypothetical protein
LIVDDREPLILPGRAKHESTSAEVAIPTHLKGIARCSFNLLRLLWTSRGTTNLLILLAILYVIGLTLTLANESRAQTRALEATARHQEAMARMQFIEFKAKGLSVDTPVAGKQLSEDLKKLKQDERSKSDESDVTAPPSPEQ